MKYKHNNTGIIGEVKEGWLYLERCAGAVCSNESISMTFIENSSDWTKVEELEYEILEFRLKYNGAILSKKDNGLFVADPHTKGEFTSEELLEGLPKPEYSDYTGDTLEYEIHKIKRLSDSQEFQIGDKVCWDWAHAQNTYYTIKSFEINTEGEFKNKIAFTTNELKDVIYKKLLHDVENYNFKLYKEPIYITADNHKIYEYDEKVHWVTNYNDGKDVRYLYDTPLRKNHLCILGENSQYKVFHDKSKALEYVESENEENKSKKEEELLDSKVLSYNDFIRFTNNLRGGYFNCARDSKELKELVKSKQ